MKNWQNIIFAPKNFSEQTSIVDISSWGEASAKLGLACSKPDLADRTRLWLGDITKLTGADDLVIVNAANATLRAGGGVCGAIHRAAGPRLERACLDAVRLLDAEPAVGDVVCTPGFDLPCQYVAHVVTPGVGTESMLAGCYRRTFDECEKLSPHVSTVCFCGLGTGSHLIPVRDAAPVAVREVAEYLELRRNDAPGEGGKKCILENVVLCCYDESDLEAYKEALVSEFG